MHIYMYIHICAYMCTCVYIHIYICMYICTYIYIHTYIPIVCVCAGMCVVVRVCVVTYVSFWQDTNSVMMQRPPE